MTETVTISLERYEEWKIKVDGFTKREENINRWLKLVYNTSIDKVATEYHRIYDEQSRAEIVSAVRKGLF